MFRQSKNSGAVLLMLAVILLFVPLAAAANDDRPTQTLTLLVLTCSIGGLSVTWLALRGRGYVLAVLLGLAAFAGGLASALVLGAIGDFAGQDVGYLASR